MSVLAYVRVCVCVGEGVGMCPCACACPCACVCACARAVVYQEVKSTIYCELVSAVRPGWFITKLLM